MGEISRSPIKSGYSQWLLTEFDWLSVTFKSNKSWIKLVYNQWLLMTFCWLDSHVKVSFLWLLSDFVVKVTVKKTKFSQWKVTWLFAWLFSQITVKKMDFSCNGSSAVELETRDFRSVPDRSWLTYFQLSRICLMYPCLPPSSRHFSPLNLVTDHHSNSGITSLLDNLMYCVSMPHGSSLPFHPTIIIPFRTSSTLLVPPPSADSTSCLWS